MKINLGKLRFEVNFLMLIRLWKKWKRYRRNGIKIVKKGCPKCKSDLEVSGLFRMCSRFGNGCDYLLIKGLKYYVFQEDFRRECPGCSGDRG